jgi:hypothetical protein
LAIASVAVAAGAVALLLWAMGASGERARRVPTGLVLEADTPALAVEALLGAGVHGATVVLAGRSGSAEEGSAWEWLPTDWARYARPFEIAQVSFVENTRRVLSRKTHAFALSKVGPARQLVQVLTPPAWDGFAGRAAAGQAGNCVLVNSESLSRFVCRAVPPLPERVVLFLSAAWFLDASAADLTLQLERARVEVGVLVVSLDADDPAVTTEVRAAAWDFAQAQRALR